MNTVTKSATPKGKRSRPESFQRQVKKPPEENVSTGRKRGTFSFEKENREISLARHSLHLLAWEIESIISCGIREQGGVWFQAEGGYEWAFFCGRREQGDE
jgi:hypothetical protein